MALSLGSVFYNLGVNVFGFQPANQQVNNFAKTVRGAQYQQEGFVRSLRNLESAAVLAVGPLSGVGARVRSLGMLLEGTSAIGFGFVTAVVATGLALYKLSEQAIKVNMEFAAMRGRLELLTGSQALANKEFEYIIDVSNRAGVQLTSTADSYTKFMAAAHGTALEGQKARDVFEALVMTGGNLRLSTDDVAGSLKALEQMMSKGRVQREELAQQLGDRLPGAFRIAAEAMGVTTAKLTQMLQKGEVAASDFLPKFADALLKAYGIDKTKAVDSLQASINRLDNSWTLFADKLDRTVGISNTFKSTLEGITTRIDFLTRNMERIIYVLKAVGGALVATFGSAVYAIIRSIFDAVSDFIALITGFNPANLISTFQAVWEIFDFGGKSLKEFLKSFSVMQDAMRQADFNTLTQSIRDYMGQNGLLRHDLVETTNALIEAAKKQLEADQKRLEGMSTNLDSLIDMNSSFAQTMPKFAAFVNAMYDVAFDPSSADGLKTKLAENIAQIQGYISALEGLKAKQEKEPVSKPAPGTTDDTGIGSTAQVRRLEDANLQLERMRAEVDAMSKGPGAQKMVGDFYDAKNAVQNFRQSLEQTKMSQDQINAKVAEFQELWNKKINLQTWADGVKELQSIITSAFDSLADTIGKSMVEGKFAIEDFVNVGKKLIEDLISKMIQLAVFNPILNAVMGTQAPTGGIGSLAALFSNGGGSVPLLARGAVLTGPTLLAGRRGKPSIAGEAGKEGVFPLVRGSNGDLGVQAYGMGGGGAVNVDVEVNVMNYSNSKVETRRTDRGIDISIFDTMMAGSISRRGTAADKALRARGRGIPRGA